MEYISSDTNIWIDFATIQKLHLPFLLPYTYIMSTDAIDDELLSPPTLREDLLRCGLVGVDITIEEFELADQYGGKYRKLSVYDRIALAIAKCRGIVLLTGDMALRRAATAEGVSILGTLGIVDRLYDAAFISKADYKECLDAFTRFNGHGIRLPQDEINIRLHKLTKAVMNKDDYGQS